MSKQPAEFKRFWEFAQKVVRVPGAQVKAQIAAERAAKKERKRVNASAETSGHVSGDKS